MAYGIACMIECSLAQVRNICTILIKNARLKSTNRAQSSCFKLHTSCWSIGPGGLLFYRPTWNYINPKILGPFIYETSFTLFNINKSSRAHEFTSGFLVGSMLLIFSVFYVVLLRILTFLVSCCDVRYHFRIQTMFGSSLFPVVCKRVRFFTFVYVSWCALGIVLVFVMCIVYPMLPFSLDCPFFVMTVWCSLTFMYSPCIMGISIFYN